MATELSTAELDGNLLKGLDGQPVPQTGQESDHNGAEIVWSEPGLPLRVDDHLWFQQALTHTHAD